MTDTDIIQPARDVLAKWRENSTSGRWEATADGYVALPTAPIASFVDFGSREEVARLIVGTAGNPDLLDAIEELLAVAIIEVPGDRYTPYEIKLVQHAERAAAAIVAADERMSNTTT